jgi:hypothetical protein
MLIWQNLWQIKKPTMGGLDLEERPGDAGAN